MNRTAPQEFPPYAVSSRTLSIRAFRGPSTSEQPLASSPCISDTLIIIPQSVKNANKMKKKRAPRGPRIDLSAGAALSEWGFFVRPPLSLAQAFFMILSAYSKGLQKTLQALRLRMMENCFWGASLFDGPIFHKEDTVGNPLGEFHFMGNDEHGHSPIS